MGRTLVMRLGRSKFSLAKECQHQILSTRFSFFNCNTLSMSSLKINSQNRYEQFEKPFQRNCDITIFSFCGHSAFFRAFLEVLQS